MNTVKKSLMLAILFTLMVNTTTLWAQSIGKHSFNVGSSLTGVSDQGLSLDLANLSEPANIEYKTTNGLPSAYFAYRFNLNDKLNFGISAQFRSYGQSVSEVSDSSNYTVIFKKVGDRVINSTNISLETQYFYFRKSTMALYSGLSAGFDFKNRQLTYLENSTNPDASMHKVSNSPNFHLSAIGFQAGKKIGGYAELGFGHKGFVQLGVYANI